MRVCVCVLVCKIVASHENREQVFRGLSFYETYSYLRTYLGNLSCVIELIVLIVISNIEINPLSQEVMLQRSFN